MATNVTEKDKTLHEVIDFLQKEWDAANNASDNPDEEVYDFYDGMTTAYEHVINYCRHMLGYSGTMPSEVPNHHSLPAPMSTWTYLYQLVQPRRTRKQAVERTRGRAQGEGHEMSAYQPVLDPACGGRMFWFDKSDDRVLFGDVRDESWELCDGRRFDVKPDMLMDYRDLPFPDGTFRMVVLDPPHLRNAGETSYMAQKYGCLDQETWKADLKTMFSECFRVLKEHGVLIFKWNETQIPVSQILKLTAHKPLFGNKQPNRTGTHWIVFMKEDAK